MTFDPLDEPAHRPNLEQHAETHLPVEIAGHRILVDYEPVGVFRIDDENHLVDVNDAICLMLGCTRQELVGKRASDLVVQSEGSNVWQESRRIDGPLGDWRECLFRCNNGTTFAAEVLATRLHDGTLLKVVRPPSDPKPASCHMTESGASDGSVAVDKPARDAADHLAELRLLNERRFSETMIESMPGIVYVYDIVGRFRRWNRNFEIVSGYPGAAIEHMHPLDFFAGDDRTLVAGRIAEVFERGESSVEALFVSRDGGTTPYYFTGRRVLFDGAVCLVGVGIDISDRRRVEDRLLESERKYRELVENANSIILRWDADGCITFLNEFGQRFFGYSADEIIGRHVLHTIVPPIETGGRNLERLMAEVLANPRAFEQNVNENIRRSGERVWIAWTNRIVRDSQGNVVEFLSIGTDVTDRQRAEARLRRSEEHLLQAQRIAKIGSWELDLRSNQLRWSDQIYEIFGIDRRNFASSYESFIEFVHPLDRERLEAAQQAALSGHARLDIEHRIVLRDGTEKVVHELADLKFDEMGHPVALEGTVHDITDRVRIETEREMRHRAEAADRIKSVFLATMSHELRTPLNSIIGFTGILLQGLAGPLNAEQKKQLDMVRASARHLLALVNDVLDISKIEAGQLEIAHKVFNVCQSIDKVLSIMAPQARAKGLDLRSRIDPALGMGVGDERRFEQILLNLLSNAVKFTESGTVELRGESLADCEFPTAAKRMPALRVQVHDTGIGIMPEDLALLFQPFRQVESGLARHHDGTGLGLAICRRLVELMGGTIEVQSEWRKGSVFTVILPRTSPVQQ